MAQRVIADASPIIILSQINGLDWLVPLFGKVWLTEIAHDELLPGGKPGEQAMLVAMNDGVLAVLEQEWPKLLFPELDEGEASCIRAALNLPEKMPSVNGRAARNALPNLRTAFARRGKGRFSSNELLGFIVQFEKVYKQMLQFCAAYNFLP